MHSLQKFDYIQTRTFCSIPVLRGDHLLATFFGSMCPKGVDGLTRLGGICLLLNMPTLETIWNSCTKLTAFILSCKFTVICHFISNQQKWHLYEVILPMF